MRIESRAGVPDTFCGEMTLQDALIYHIESTFCLEECTYEYHDDTCIIGIMERCLPLVVAEEGRNPALTVPSPTPRAEAHRSGEAGK